MKIFIILVLICFVGNGALAQQTPSSFNVLWETQLTPEELGENQGSTPFPTSLVRPFCITSMPGGNIAVGAGVTSSPMVVTLSADGGLSRSFSRPSFLRNNSTVHFLRSGGHSIHSNTQGDIIYYTLEGVVNPIARSFQMIGFFVQGDPPVPGEFIRSTDPDDEFAVFDTRGFYLEVQTEGFVQTGILSGRRFDSTIGAEDRYPSLTRMTGSGVELLSAIHTEVPIKGRGYFPSPPTITTDRNIVYAVSASRYADMNNPEAAFGYHSQDFYLVYADSVSLRYEKHLYFNSVSLGLPGTAKIEIRQVISSGNMLYVIGFYKLSPFDQPVLFITLLEDGKVKKTIQSENKVSDANFDAAFDEVHGLVFVGSRNQNNERAYYILKASTDLSQQQEHIWGEKGWFSAVHINIDGSLTVAGCANIETNSNGDLAGNLVVMKLSVPLSISEQGKKSNIIKLLPNPTTSVLEYRVGEEYVHSSYLISDIYGRLHLLGTIESTRSSILLRSLSSGMYFFTITTRSGKQVTERFIVRK